MVRALVCSPPSLVHAIEPTRAILRPHVGHADDAGHWLASIDELPQANSHTSLVALTTQQADLSFPSSRWPPLLRTIVQDYLTLGWTVRLPIIQHSAPCALAARTLTRELGSSLHNYVYVDFASGSGGPTPFFEKHVNEQLEGQGREKVGFVMTDISPHVGAWQTSCKKSESGMLGFVGESVDATDAPSREVLLKGQPGWGGEKSKKSVMRLFSLAFHHFDDDLAVGVLRDAMRKQDGFCIFELQSRNLASLVMVSLLWPLAMLIAPIYFWTKPLHLLFTYLIPAAPFVWVFDGYISSLRTRTVSEVEDLMRRAVGDDEFRHWKIRSGEEMHTLVLGKLYWLIATRKE